MIDNIQVAAEWNRRIPLPDPAAAEAAWKRWDAVAKPRRSLGRLEEAVARIASVTGDPRYAIDKRALLVLCADNGVVGRRVTQVPAEVTLVLARCLAEGNISVCRMAGVARADVVGVDMGMAQDLALPTLLNLRVAAGTGDIAAGPAMTREQAFLALERGMGLAARMRDLGYKILLTGEVGMGNTTTSSAMAAVLLRKEPAEVTGRGAGLSDEGLKRKIAVVEEAIRVNRPNAADPLDILAKLGGFDIAGMAGLFLGAAALRMPILIDGFISSVAALTAARLCPNSVHAMLASHVSAEPAGVMVLEELGLSPLICAGMCLGEGTGAVAALPLLDMAYSVYDTMLTYDDLKIG